MEIDIFDKSFKLFVEQRQWNKLFAYVISYILGKPAGIMAAALFFCVFALCFFAMAAKGRRKRLLKRSALICYVIVLLLAFIFNRDQGIRDLRLSLEAWTLEGGFHESVVILTLVDFIFFFLLGILLRWQHRWHAHWLSSFGIIALFGFSIELLQYIMARGAASTEDFLAYVLGGMLGVAFAHLFMRKRY